MLSEKEIAINHEICLELLDKFVEVCEKNGVEYYLAFGSCLGAIRHQGYIPWDINIDVLMTWDEFKKLDAAMKTEELGRYKWCCPENDSRIFPLLCRDDYWDYESNPNIDVAVYVNAPKSEFFRELIRKLAYLNIKMFKLKNTRVKRSFPFNILKGISSLIPNKAYAAVVKAFSKINKDNDSEYKMVVLPSVWENREYLKTEWIGQKPIYASFEGRRVRVIENHHEYLKMRYGASYMTPKVWKDKGEYKHVKK